MAFEVNPVGKSLIQTSDKSPGIEPCGTPASISDYFEVRSLTRILLNRSGKASLLAQYILHIFPWDLVYTKDHNIKLYQMLQTCLGNLISLSTKDLHQMLRKCHELLKLVDVDMNHQVYIRIGYLLRRLLFK